VGQADQPQAMLLNRLQRLRQLAVPDAVFAVLAAGIGFALGHDLEAISAGGGLSIPYRFGEEAIDTAHYFGPSRRPCCSIAFSACGSSLCQMPCLLFSPPVLVFWLVEQVIALGHDLEAISAGGGLSIPYRFGEEAIDTSIAFSACGSSLCQMPCLLFSPPVLVFWLWPWPKAGDRARPRP
jgi:hypothetical protein